MLIAIIITLISGIFYFANKAFDRLDDSDKYYYATKDPFFLGVNYKEDLIKYYSCRHDYYENLLISALCFLFALVIAGVNYL